jgi:hypothetical protein
MMTAHLYKFGEIHPILERAHGFILRECAHAGLFFDLPVHPVL